MKVLPRANRDANAPAKSTKAAPIMESDAETRDAVTRARRSWALHLASVV